MPFQLMFGLRKRTRNMEFHFFGQVAPAERLERENISALSSFGFHCFLASRKIFQNGPNIKEYEAPCPAAFLSEGKNKQGCPWMSLSM